MRCWLGLRPGFAHEEGGVLEQTSVSESSSCWGRDILMHARSLQRQPLPPLLDCGL